MTRNKDLKKIVRIRMKKTGESYTAARARVVAKTTPKESPVRRPAPAIDHAALAGMRDEKVAEKTGHTWPEWTRLLDGDGATSMAHRDIAALVHEKYGVGEWWTQTVTVGYERIKGLRDRGQRRGGSYETSKSRTVNVPVKTLFDAWNNVRTRRRWLDGVDLVIRTTTSPKSMRLQWPDGTLVLVGFYPKGHRKSMVAVAHTKLKDKAAADRAKVDWTARLDALASVIGPKA